MKKEFLKISILIFLFFFAKAMIAQNEYSGISNIQFMYGKDIQPKGTQLATVTTEHVGSYGAFEHFGFADFFYIPENGSYNIYSEWYPKLSLSRARGKELNLGSLKDVLIGGGYNALVLDISNFFVVLGGPVWQFKVPGFNLFQLETYFYQHLGFPISYQITYAWDLPIPITEKYKLRTRGFIDLIGPYGTYDTQIITQPQLLLDVGNLWETPDKVFVGTEWRHWHNFLGMTGRVESIPQLDILIQF